MNQEHLGAFLLRNSQVSWTVASRNSLYRILTTPVALLRVLDRPRVDREPPRPRVVQKHSRGPAAPAPKLCRLDLDAARLEGMDSERGVPALDVTYLLLAHHPSLE